MYLAVQLPIQPEVRFGALPAQESAKADERTRDSDDAYAPESIELLTGSGLNFKQHEDHGIDMEYFGEILISSGLVLLDDVRWISFHSGYDFGYILKTVSMLAMPVGEADFFDLLKIWFPCVYDIKYIMRSCKSLRGGLNDVAKDLGVRVFVQTCLRQLPRY